METILGGLILIALIGLVLGLVSPRWVLGWGKNRSRREVLVYYGWSIPILFWVANMISDPGLASFADGLALLAFWGLVLGLIRPDAVLWGFEKATRFHVVSIYLCAFLVIMAISDTGSHKSKAGVHSEIPVAYPQPATASSGFKVIEVDKPLPTQAERIHSLVNLQQPRAPLGLPATDMRVNEPERQTTDLGHTTCDSDQSLSTCPQSFPQGSHARLLCDFFKAWREEDWDRMADCSLLTRGASLPARRSELQYIFGSMRVSLSLIR